MKIYLVTAFVITLAVSAVAQSGQPVVKYGGTKRTPRIIEMSNMFGGEESIDMRCSRLRPFVGTIVKRDFDEDEVMVTNITIRDTKDERVHLNVDSEQISLLGRTAPTIISSFLGKGKRVKVWAYTCSGGGSGNFLYVDRVVAF